MTRMPDHQVWGLGNIGDNGDTRRVDEVTCPPP
jgi:hypothetical protein